MDFSEALASTASAQAQMNFQRYMSDTAHVREVKDLQAAGLNPVLSAGGQGASSPSGASGDMSAFLGVLSKSLDTSAKAVTSLGRNGTELANALKKGIEGLGSSSGSSAEDNYAYQNWKGKLTNLPIGQILDDLIYGASGQHLPDAVKGSGELFGDWLRRNFDKSAGVALNQGISSRESARYNSKDKPRRRGGSF